MEVSAPQERQHAFPLQTALMALTAFSGSLIGGLLPRFFALWMGVDADDPVPYRLPLLAASLTLIPAIFIILRIPYGPDQEEPEPSEVQAAMPSVAREPIPTSAPSRVRLESSIAVTLLLLAIVRFFQVSGVATSSTFFNVYMDTALNVPTAQIGMIAAVARLGGVFAALGTPLLVARYGAARTVVLASTITTLSLLPLALVPHWIAAGVGFLGVTAISSMRYPAFMLFAIDQVPPSWRGTLAGSGEFAGGVSFAGMALVGGYLIAAGGFTPLFLLGSGLTLVGTLLFYLWFALPRPKPVPTPAPRPMP
jgi:predicted MFS family arabinose efflux permease